MEFAHRIGLCVQMEDTRIGKIPSRQVSLMIRNDSCQASETAVAGDGLWGPPSSLRVCNHELCELLLLPNVVLRDACKPEQKSNLEGEVLLDRRKSRVLRRGWIRAGGSWWVEICGSVLVCLQSSSDWKAQGLTPTRPEAEGQKCPTFG